MVVLAFAIALVYISYFVSKDVTDNVLWYFGQSLMYVASIFGVSIAMDVKFDKFKKLINHNNNEKERLSTFSFIALQADRHGQSMPCSRNSPTRAGTILDITGLWKLMAKLRNS